MDDEMTSARADELLRTPKADREQTDSQIMDLWVQWLYETYGEGLPSEALAAVYGKAWQDGHSAGLHEVEGYFIELVALAIEIIEAVR